VAQGPRAHGLMTLKSKHALSCPEHTLRPPVELGRRGMYSQVTLARLGQANPEVTGPGQLSEAFAR
jgi:hypothetical protein